MSLRTHYCALGWGASPLKTYHIIKIIRGARDQAPREDRVNFVRISEAVNGESVDEVFASLSPEPSGRIGVV